MSGSGGYCCDDSGGLTDVVGLITDDLVVVPANPATGDIRIQGASGVVTSGNAATYTVTITDTTSGFTWNDTTSSLTMSVGNGYYCSGGGALSLALPSTSVFGDEIAIILDGATSFTITQSAGQQVRLASSQTTLGATGSLASTAQGDQVTLVCKTANTIWSVVSVIGNLTVT